MVLLSCEQSLLVNYLILELFSLLLLFGLLYFLQQSMVNPSCTILILLLLKLLQSLPFLALSGVIMLSVKEEPGRSTTTGAISIPKLSLDTIARSLLISMSAKVVICTPRERTSSVEELFPESLTMLIELSRRQELQGLQSANRYNIQVQVPEELASVAVAPEADLILESIPEEVPAGWIYLIPSFEVVLECSYSKNSTMLPDVWLNKLKQVLKVLQLHQILHLVPIVLHVIIIHRLNVIQVFHSVHIQLSLWQPVSKSAGSLLILILTLIPDLILNGSLTLIRNKLQLH